MILLLYINTKVPLATLHHHRRWAIYDTKSYLISWCEMQIKTKYNKSLFNVYFISNPHLFLGFVQIQPRSKWNQKAQIHFLYFVSIVAMHFSCIFNFTTDDCSKCNLECGHKITWLRFNILVNWQLLQQI